MRKISIGRKGSSEKKNRKHAAGGFPFRKAGPAAAETAQTDGFSVNVRNTEPMLRVSAPKKKIRAGGLMGTVLSSLVLASVLALFLISIEAPMLVPCVLAGVVTYTGAWLIRNKLNERFRLMTMIIIVLVFIASLVVLRKFIGGGLALIVNNLFELSELEQAYVYDMYPVGSHGESSPTLCMGIAAAWCSAFMGFITGLPDEKRRWTINTILVIAAMIGFAYLGIIPAWAGAMPVIAAFLISAGSGRLGSVWPLIIAVLLVFGGIVAIDPGPVDAVSRANENLRDIFAFKTALIQGVEDPFMEEEFYDAEDWEEEEEWVEEEEEYESGSLSTLMIILGVALVAIAAAVYLIHRRLAKKRKLIRADIGSTDPNKAIGAMFPYAVRWLRCCGIDVGNSAFSELVPDIRKGIGSAYAERFDEMMKLWREAVFSDHVLTEENRQTMSLFMKDTINMSRKKANWKEKLKVRFKYAL